MALVLTVGEIFVTYLGQAVMLQGITEMAKDIYTTIHSCFILKCPELLLFLEKLDIENSVQNVEQLFNECEIKKESHAIRESLCSIKQIIILIKNEMKKIEKIVIEHQKKFLHKLRKPNYKLNLNRLEVYNDVLNKRFNHFLEILKVINNDNIKIRKCHAIDNYNLDSYEIVKYEDTRPSTEDIIRCTEFAIEDKVIDIEPIKTHCNLLQVSVVSES